MRNLDLIRTTLLKQHADIRTLIESARGAANALPIDVEHLRAILGRLIVAVRLHNSDEEEALKNVLPKLDAWGPQRTAIMNEEHFAEHHELYSTLLAASEAKDPRIAAASVLELADQLLEHMEHEEKLFLGPKVLTDDIRTDGMGG